MYLTLSSHLHYILRGCSEHHQSLTILYCLILQVLNNSPLFHVLWVTALPDEAEECFQSEAELTKIKLW